MIIVLKLLQMWIIKAVDKNFVRVHNRPISVWIMLVFWYNRGNRRCLFSKNSRARAFIRTGIITPDVVIGRRLNDVNIKMGIFFNFFRLLLTVLGNTEIMVAMVVKTSVRTSGLWKTVACQLMMSMGVILDK